METTLYCRVILGVCTGYIGICRVYGSIMGAGVKECPNSGLHTIACRRSGIFDAFVAGCNTLACRGRRHAQNLLNPKPLNPRP